MHESFKKRKPDVVSGFLKPLGMIVSKCKCGAIHYTNAYLGEDEFIVFDKTKIEEPDIEFDIGEGAI